MLSLEVSLYKVWNGCRLAFQDRWEEAPLPEVRPNSGALSLALGHRFVQAVERQEAADFSDLARNLNLSQARISMLVALTFLAPDLQEELLRGGPEVAHLNIHHLLMVARQPAWADQRRFWAGLRRGSPTELEAVRNELH